MTTPLNFTSELVPVAYAAALLELAEAFGATRRELFAEARVRPGVLESPRGRLSILEFNQLASCALRRCNEPALGLLLGQRLNVSSHGILGYAVLASANLGKAIEFVLKYYRVLGLTYELELVEQGERIELRARESLPLGPLSRFAGEALLASLHGIACFLLGKPLGEVEVGFVHAAPPYVARYVELFGGPVAFQQPYLRLSMPAAYLARPMALANPATVQMCERQCEALLAGLDVEDPLLTRVRRLLLARPGNFPDLDGAALALHISGRSLRRHLAGMGVSYQQLLNEVRKELAQQYLSGTRLPLYEIAELLGFSDPSNFRRAFKKWTGKLPSDYRIEE
ncbi:AraC family transcriptional regulator [Pseudomonas benzenivorans]|uniref:AraC family transcriptional regulator n=1 Tax=Pseudomonas benzenivorans TaxID=556533 RepID=A0ABY5H4B1_9PSED|nr:AraC family transcriptional regulator [Pseudomonas benzenivorans]UTW06909.1 AraC family transcriptional regulator [Pseudomonas benzenivorans]